MSTGTPQSKLQRLSDDRIIAAIVEAGGYIEHASRLLHCSKQTIYSRIQESAEVKAALEEARDEMDRAADITLLDAVHGKGIFRNDPAARVRAAMFIKNNSPVSKARGWGARTELTGANGGPITLEAWREARTERQQQAAQTTALFEDLSPSE